MTERQGTGVVRVSSRSTGRQDSNPMQSEACNANEAKAPRLPRLARQIHRKRQSPKRPVMTPKNPPEPERFRVIHDSNVERRLGAPQPDSVNLCAIPDPGTPWLAVRNQQGNYRQAL